jgi:5-methyltetrahydrofolate--homocysteine methyltransferase
MNPLESLLKKQEYILADGAIGTTLMDVGLSFGDPPEAWNTLYPERIRAMHKRFIEAGSQIILTNSFGGTRFRLNLHGLQDQVADLNRAAGELARGVADEAPHTVVVGGSMGPSGEILAPLGDLSFEEAKAGFAEQAEALTSGGVDVLWIETMSDLNEARAAALGAREVSNLPIVITMTFDTNGYTMMGVSPTQAIEALKEFSPLVIGGNCGNGPDEIEGVIKAMYATGVQIPLVAKSNAGIPELKNGQSVYCATPKEMARYAVRVRDFGATIIGGCCGNSVNHLRAMAEALKKTPVNRVSFSEPVDQMPSRENHGRVRHRRHTRNRNP